MGPVASHPNVVQSEVAIRPSAGRWCQAHLGSIELLDKTKETLPSLTLSLKRRSNNWDVVPWGERNEMLNAPRIGCATFTVTRTCSIKLIGQFWIATVSLLVWPKWVLSKSRKFDWKLVVLAAVNAQSNKLRQTLSRTFIIHTSPDICAVALLRDRRGPLFSQTDELFGV